MRDTETLDATGITSEEQLLQKAKKLLATDAKYACNLKYPFSKKSMCMHRDCRSQAEERIFFINEDTVHEADVCTNHAVLFKQGNKVIFPFKLGYTPCETP